MRRPQQAAVLVVALVALGAAAPSFAVEPTLSEDNACVYPDLRETCVSAADCAGNDYATICVEHTLGAPGSRRCEIPCELGEGVSVARELSACATGETCLEARATPGRKAFFCQPSRFRVDLNLLDQCVAYHLQGLQPTFSDNVCSLEANLTGLLDQNHDQVFDIFDLDLCVVSFLERPGCDPETGACEQDDLVACDSDDACGRGLHCDPQLNTCQRDCGLISAREPGFTALERQCSGNGKVCDFDRGRCVDVDVTRQTCDVDNDCPAGSHCFLGRCAPSCYRSLDCPSNGWYCAPNNRCRALPHPDADEGFVFEPENYAIRFVRDELRVDPVSATDRSALIILELQSKKAVVGNPSVTFGYRLELTYGLKEDTRCLRGFVDCAEAAQRPAGESEADCRARQDDCFVDDTEQWLTLDSPFGTVNGIGGAALGVRLDATAAERLSPGVYKATLRAIFDNGDSDSIRVSYTKASPSGTYDGQVSVYRGSPTHPLNGEEPLAFAMHLKVYEDQPRQWNTLLEEYHLGTSGGDEASFVDITSGVLVHGELDSESAFAYQASGSRRADAKVPFVGLYSPGLNRMRVVGMIEIAKDLCVGADGDCRPNDAAQLKVTNPFGRTIRRQIEFIGPFDASIGRFHGIYREKISGLAADFDVTLEGGFIMDQLVADGSPLDVTPDSVLAADAPKVNFPSDATVLAALNADIAQYCVPGPAAATDPAAATYAKTVFASEATFDAYLATARRRGVATTTSTLGRTTVFPAIREFESSIAEALAGLGQSGIDGAASVQQQSYLNVYDFLEDYIGRCDDADPTPPPVCVREAAVRCGLALHQKALIRGWVDADQVQGAATNPVIGELDLFCPDTLALAGCPASAGGNPALFAMQEHNRFWVDLTQSLKLDADAARSDAFLVLFRNAVNPFAVGAALAFKADRLRDSLRAYDDIVAQMVGPASAKVLFNWPARAFKSSGDDWLNIMHAVISDRMAALADLIDLERRVFLSAGSAEFAFAQHLMQHEFLMQVYLMVLQSRWQGESFDYRGQAAAVIQKGQLVLNQLNPAKNAIGVTPNQVFFENSILDQNNWLNYRSILVGEDGADGLIGEGHALVADAVENLQSALADLDTLQLSLHEGSGALTATLNDICGDPNPFADDTKPTSYCQLLLKQFDDADQWERIRDCKFATYIEDNQGDIADYLGKDYKVPTDCPAGGSFAADITCTGADSESDGCAEIVKTFFQNTAFIDGSLASTDLIQGPLECRLDASKQPKLSLNGVQRPCVGGEVGALLQEQAAVDVDRNAVVGSVETLLKQVQSVYQRLDDIHKTDNTYAATLAGLSAGVVVIETILNALAATIDVTDEIGETSDCIIIGGLAVGTDCAGKLGSKLAAFARKVVFYNWSVGLGVVRDGLNIGKDFAAFVRETASYDFEGASELRLMVREIDGLIDAYHLLTQTSFNLTAQLEDARFRAREAVRAYNGDVKFVADHLLGRESGNPILGQAQVQEASNKFREVLTYLYRMTVAFIHEYNLTEGDAATLIARSQAVVTLEEAEAFAGELSDRERDYCGISGLDCDAVNNTETVRVSLREILFPNLRDIVDAHTGQVLTAGQQFHNLITQPPFLRRRIRANQPTDQIEIPFAVSLQALENTPSGDPRWLIDPLSCNHLIDSRDPTDATSSDHQDSSGSRSGSIAVNVVGQNIDDPSEVVRYQLARGPIDFIRGCEIESKVAEIGTQPVTEYPINKHTIGYAPQHRQGSKSTPASFVSVSQPLTACVNTGEVQGSLDAGLCWRYFARDRSLAAPDWKLIIPLVVGNAQADSGWILGDGLPADVAPVIEDLVVYMRFRSRPVEED